VSATPSPADLAAAARLLHEHEAHWAQQRDNFPAQRSDLNERIASAVAAARAEERERCVKVALGLLHGAEHVLQDAYRNGGIRECAEAIRTAPGGDDADVQD
jgi:hypothetical protein